jgi:hypothetical protein
MDGVPSIKEACHTHCYDNQQYDLYTPKWKHRQRTGKEMKR